MRSFIQLCQPTRFSRQKARSLYAWQGFPFRHKTHILMEIVSASPIKSEKLLTFVHVFHEILKNKTPVNAGTATYLHIFIE